MDNPFFHTKVECPVCGNENSFDTIRVGAYVESGRDTDFCPTGIKWRFSKYSSYNPLVFFVATCPSCYYSREFNESFKTWKSDATFKTYRLKRIKERHLSESGDPDSIIMALGKSIDLENAPNESAISRILLAIIDEQFNEHPSHLDLGRLYLRIGWLYRDINSSSPGSSGETSAALTDLDAGLREWMTAFNTWALKRKRLFELMAETNSAEMSSCEALMEEILAHEAKCGELVTELGDKLSASPTKDSAPLTGKPFGGAESLYAFLKRLKGRWPDIPLNEREALARSIEHYRMSLETGKEVSAGSQQAQVCYLIGELSRRIGQYAEAREYFNAALKSGQAFVQKYRNDTSRTALARRILELSMEQSQLCREQAKAAKTGA